MARTRYQTKQGIPPLDDAIVKKGWDHWLIIRPETVTKKELRPSEYPLSGGRIIAPYWFKELLRNEAATLDFIRESTTIPVPKCRLYEEDGLLCLETSRIQSGTRLINAISNCGPAAREKIVNAIDAQINEDILPQLQVLRRNTIGSVDESIPVFPPYRVFAKDRRSWPRITASSEEFIFCHNHLHAHNIFIDADTYKIVAIIGWECGGYFPSYFELPSWRDSVEEDEADPDDACRRELAFFGLEPGDLLDDSAKAAR